MTTITDKEYDSMLAEIESWKGAHSVAAADRDILKALCARAADALDEDQPLVTEPVESDFLGERKALIAELRKAAAE